MRMPDLGCGEPRLENAVSYLLLGGVVISLCLEVTGLVIFYHAYGNFDILLQDQSVFIQGRNFFIFLFETFNSAGLHNQAIFFMTLGMAVLVLTPYLLVVTSFIFFLFKRNYRYTFITGFLITIITVSLSLH
jgi:uncharacterized membrane protein